MSPIDPLQYQVQYQEKIRAVVESVNSGLTARALVGSIDSALEAGLPKGFLSELRKIVSAYVATIEEIEKVIQRYGQKTLDQFSDWAEMSGNPILNLLSLNILSRPPTVSSDFSCPEMTEPMVRYVEVDQENRVKWEGIVCLVIEAATGNLGIYDLRTICESTEKGNIWTKEESLLRSESGGYWFPLFRQSPQLNGRVVEEQRFEIPEGALRVGYCSSEETWRVLPSSSQAFSSTGFSAAQFDRTHYLATAYWPNTKTLVKEVPPLLKRYSMETLRQICRCCGLDQRNPIAAYFSWPVVSCKNWTREFTWGNMVEPMMRVYDLHSGETHIATMMFYCTTEDTETHGRWCSQYMITPVNTWMQRTLNDLVDRPDKIDWGNPRGRGWFARSEQYFGCRKPMKSWEQYLCYKTRYDRGEFLGVPGGLYKGPEFSSDSEPAPLNPPEESQSNQRDDLPKLSPSDQHAKCCTVM